MKEKSLKKGITRRLLSVVLALLLVVGLMAFDGVAVYALSATDVCSCGHMVMQHDVTSGSPQGCYECGCAAFALGGAHTHTAACYGTKTATTHSTNCGLGTAVTAEEHVWDDGTCTICGYACVHEFGEWQYAPSHGDEYRNCTKCHKEERRAVASSSSSSSSSAPAAPTAEQMHEEYAKAVEATVAKEEALPVTSFASEAAVKAIPAEVKADNAATLNISAVTTTQGFVATINKVAKATTAPSMAVYSAKPITMNATALNAVAKTGKTLVYTFTYKGHIYKVTIPAGAQVNTNGQMFMGPLAIGAQLGTTQVIK